MNTHRIGFAFALPLILAACNPSESSSGSGGSGEGGGTCESDNGCGGQPNECPDESDASVHYISHDPAECGLTDCGGPETDCVPCSGSQEYFETECGCGCIDIPEPAPVCPSAEDPTVHYISENPAECAVSDCGGAGSDCIPCSVDQEYFSNECGCGCIDVIIPPTCPSPKDPSVHYISQDPATCVETDCGAQVDCIPCEPNQEYFDNECGCGCIDTDQ